MYKTVLHATFLTLSILIILTGISTRISVVQSSQSLEIQGSLEPGDIDLLEQGGSIQTTLASVPGVYFVVNQYRVNAGDSVQSIADQFKVSKDTIKWANSSIDYFDENIQEGQVLQIPEIPGVLYEIQEGDNLNSILEKTSGDRLQVIEINQLAGPDYPLTIGSRILIPDGKLPPPPPKVPQIIYTRIPTNYGLSGVVGNGQINGITTANPLSNPDCAGYVFNRGFWGIYLHDGIDLGRNGGCPIRAIADGTVVYAGWENLSGFTVKIEHGDGVKSLYYHGDGNIWVRVGDRVSMGQDIMYMGSTGNSIGTHLHFTLAVKGVPIDPAPYLPY